MLTESLNQYFYQQINNAKQHQKMLTSDATIYYLSYLLAKPAFDFSKQIYLFDLYQNSIKSKNKFDRFNNYKTLGDYTLIISGYFPESLYHKSVSVSYYIDLGSSAYHEIADVSKIYQELSSSYKDIVSILNEVSEHNRAYTADDIFELYALWVRTNNPDIKNKLARLGMMVGEVQE